MKLRMKKITCLVLAASCILGMAQSPRIARASREYAGARADYVMGGDTLYAIGSVSKMYVTVAAMQLVDKGLLSLEEPVVTYLPEFTMADPRYKDITVRMLMDHTSGLMGSTIEDATLYEDNDTSAKDNLLARLKKQRLKANPGEFSAYCNDGFDLLEILVERVSGEDFTEYVARHIVAPLGGSQTGSYKNAFQSPYHVPVYDANNQPCAHEYHIGIGAGGVLSTAAEVCSFGSTFFTGDHTLLSEKSKNRMVENESKNKYEGNYALGWDDVDIYADYGVKVVGKGGDLYTQHASLLVAPEEKISVAVCTSGGNSAVDEMFAMCLLNVALKERGIEIKEKEKPEIKTEDTVPAEYLAYAGFYAKNQGIAEISFPEGSYMQIKVCDEQDAQTIHCKYAGNGQFVKMLGDVSQGSNVQDGDTALYSFTTRENGKTYLLVEEAVEYPRLGNLKSAMYYAEKMEENTVSAAAKAAWEERAGYYFYISGKYSSSLYDAPVMEVAMSETADGYVYGTELHKIADETHAVAFVEIPGHAGRDLMDLTAVQRDGKEYIVIDGNDAVFLKGEYITELTPEVTEITFTKREAQWFLIGKTMGGSLISFEKTEHTSVYIYDKSGACTYNTYLSGFGDKIPLPMEGSIVFVGEPGESVGISYGK